ncbi:CGNR zinc finger domain-containing protein [Microbacterium terricola]|uniref:HTH lacI-type domain-containing protein n=1 Tax=Microbacterium terricola TaxID=344163 RepID=A0ABM8DVS2_9MICO|nr:LacI family DNA-binding transcriptional regulator [Microbacterium terricola]BDV29610.1 hypothetical protein Microterr_02700 [Microbacterium terricola]
MSLEMDAAPPSIRLVAAFVNSVEWQEDEDTWRSPADLGRWFVAHAQTDAGQLTADDLRLAQQIREGLREVLLAHAGHEPLAAALDGLNEGLRSVPVRLSFAPDGAPALTGMPGAAAGFGVIVQAIETARADGSWSRLKACARDTCRWAYWDDSRNGSARWCSMAGCGNYVKMRRRNSPGSARDEAIPAAGSGTRAPRLLDVAARSGVSMKTVSNVVTGRIRVAEATRIRVQAAIDELGYRPNQAARELRAERVS